MVQKFFLPAKTQSAAACRWVSLRLCARIFLFTTALAGSFPLLFPALGQRLDGEIPLYIRLIQLALSSKLTGQGNCILFFL